MSLKKIKENFFEKLKMNKFDLLVTVIEFARRFNRPIAVKMMEDYVKKYNLQEEN